MAELQDIARTLTTLAIPGMRPKDLFTAVRKQHPKASKKEISRAAFFAMILSSEADPDKASRVHELAIASRGGDDRGEDADLAIGSRGKTKKRTLSSARQPTLPVDNAGGTPDHPTGASQTVSV